MKKISYSFQSVKARLFPISSIMQRIEYLIEMLPRQRYRVDIHPIHDITVLNARKGQYKALSNTPRFELESETTFKGGWYYFEAALTNNNGNREANLYAVDKHGQETVIPIPSNLRGSVREVIFIPHKTITLFWSPTASFGFFSQSTILLHKITWLESYIRRVFRIIFDYIRFKEKHTVINTIKLVWEIFTNVQKAYNENAKERITRVVGKDYAVFIKKHSRLSKKQSRLIKNEIRDWESKLLFSFILLVDRYDVEKLTMTISSIQGQLYRYFELLILVEYDRLSQQELYELKMLIRGETRFKLINIASSTQHTEKLNIALEKCSGDYIAIVEQSDIVHRNALYRVMQKIMVDSNVKIIYSDSDTIDENGNRSEPCFKPDWNPDLFYSCDYIGRMCFYYTQIVRKSGGFRSGYDGAEEYDMTLRLVVHLNTDEIAHIPKILYHQYRSSETKSFSPIGRIRDHDSGKRALQDLFNKTGSSILDGLEKTLYRVKYPLVDHLPLVSIIIPTRDRADILKVCIESVLEHTEYPNWEMIIIDNNSIQTQTHDYFEKISKDHRINVYPYNKPFNYSELNNFALKHAKGEILTLLNNDIEIISRGWLSEMVRHVLRPEIGVVGAKLLYPDRVVQHAGVIIGIGGVAGHGHKFISDDDPGYCHRAIAIQSISAVTGACLCVRRSVYTEVNGLDENLAVAFNDIDFCLKVREIGYRNLYTPYAKLIHYESISRGHDDTPKKHALFVKEFTYMKEKWGNKLLNDPAYNPNLTHDFENFGW